MFKHQIVTVLVPGGVGDIDVVSVPAGLYWMLYKWTARLGANTDMIALLDGEVVDQIRGPAGIQVIHPNPLDGAINNMFPIPAKDTIGGRFNNTGAAANSSFLIWYVEFNVGEI